MNVEGKTALVTGGAVRIGREITWSLARAGARVALHYYRSGDAARQLQVELQEAGLPCAILGADLADPSGCEGLLSAASKDLGPVEILILNAAIFPPEGFTATTVASWDRQFSVNLRAPFLLSRALLEQLDDGRTGSIVAITDARVGRGVRGPFAYQLTKAALEEMVRLLALELAPRVRVNAVAPGAIMAPVHEDQAAFDARAATAIPLGRAGGAEAVAEAVLYLLREDFATGTVLRLDGGEYL